MSVIAMGPIGRIGVVLHGGRARWVNAIHVVGHVGLLGSGRSSHRLRNGGCRRSGFGSGFLGHVFLHFIVEANLVLCSHILVFLLFLRWQCAPTFSHNGTQFHKLDSRIFLHDLGPHIEGEKDKASTGTFGSGRILDLLDFAMLDPVILNQIALGVVARRRHVGRHLGIETCLVLGCATIPCSLLLRRQALVHCRSVLGQLSKRHPRILAPELISHGILIQEIGTHVAFGSVGISLRFAAPCS
mmetsp:Transcript_26670/g.62040  ORF Transcript_26670/g.62040 Transcript_26670/m.62040 type:complete len:243 (-) Transcript_26670:854-1582(-)